MIANLTQKRLLTHKCTHTYIYKYIYIYIVNLMCVWILTCVHVFSFFVSIEFRQVFVYLNYATSCTEFYWEMPGLKPMDMGHCVFPNVDSILWSLGLNHQCKKHELWLFIRTYRTSFFDRSCRASPVNTKTRSQSIIFLGEKSPDITGVLGATETQLYPKNHHYSHSITIKSPVLLVILWYILIYSD